MRKNDQVALRMTTELRDRIKAAAEANKRSMNSELLFHIERIYPDPDQHQTLNRGGDREAGNGVEGVNP